jgi:RNA polymerase sigma factor for flagellar operon FliA
MASDPPDDLPPDQLFLKSLPLIEKLIAFSCRQSRFSREDGEDFSSWVKLKLIEGNYGVLRAFQRRCSLATYLSTVIQRLAQDYRNHLWGKRRASAEAERLGEVAIRLEQLLLEHSPEEAYRFLRINEKVEMSEDELADLRAKLPPRVGRHIIGEEGLLGEPARDLRPDQELEEKQKERTQRRVNAAFYRALVQLPPEDGLLIRLNMTFKVAEIARVRQLEQKPLYRRLEKIFKTLRKLMEAEGIRREEIKEILGSLEPDRLVRPKKKG